MAGEVYVKDLVELEAQPADTDYCPIWDTSTDTYLKILHSNLVPDATTTSEGKAELATDAEVEAMTDNARTITPGGLGSIFLDEDDLASDSATKLASQQSIKAYADSLLNLIRVSSNDTTPGYLNGKLVAGEGVDLTEGSDGGDETLTISGEDASTTNKGISSFKAEHFDVSSGHVSLDANVPLTLTTDDTNSPSPLVLAPNKIYIIGGEGIGTSSAAEVLTITAEDATTTNKGVLEIATDAEAVTGTATDKALVPSNITALTRGSAFPASPVEGMEFYRTDLDCKFVYDSTNTQWKCLRSDAALTIYLDSGSGADTIGKGYGSGANACATWGFMLDYVLPRKLGGNLTINMSSAVYSETLDLKGIDAGFYSIIFEGTLTEVIASAALDSAVAGTTTTAGSITDTAAFTVDASELIANTGVTAGDSQVEVADDTDFDVGSVIVLDPAGAGNGPEVHTVMTKPGGNVLTFDGIAESNHAVGQTVIQSGNANQLIYSSSGTEYRRIDWNDADTAYIVGHWTAIPSANYVVYSHGTKFNKFIIGSGQKAVKFYDIEFTGSIYSEIYSFTDIEFYRCAMTPSSNVYCIQFNSGKFLNMVFNECYLAIGYDGNAWALRLTKAAAKIDNTKITGLGFASTGIELTLDSSLTMYSSIIEGFDTRGISCLAFSNANLWTGGRYNYTRNCLTGIYRDADSASYTTNVQFSGCTTDTDLN